MRGEDYGTPIPSLGEPPYQHHGGENRHVGETRPSGNNVTVY